MHVYLNAARLLAARMDSSAILRDSLILNARPTTAEALADHGLDPYWYRIRGHPEPTFEQQMMLYARLMELLDHSSAHVSTAIRDRTYKKLLGEAFTWVRTPYEM